MCNSIFIDKKTLSKAKDGEAVEITIKGVYHTDEEGVRKLDVESVDGNPVVGPDEEETECGCSGEPEIMDADDAMRIFFIKSRKE